MLSDVEGIVDFLVREKGFDEARVRSGIKRVVDNRGKAGQCRMESFFKVLPKPAGSPTVAKKDAKGAAGAKRKDAPGGTKAMAKKGKSGVGGGKK